MVTAVENSRNISKSEVSVLQICTG